MKGDILSRTDLLFLPDLTVILFTAIFLRALFWIYRPGSKSSYDARSRMPLDDENPVDPFNPLEA